MTIKTSTAPSPAPADTLDTASADESLDAAALAFAALDEDGDADEPNDDGDEDDLSRAAAALDDAPDDEPADDPDPAPTDPVIEFAGEDGQLVRVPKSEIGKGYLRQADYTRKTQAAAEKTKEALALAERYAARLQTVEQVLAAEIPAEPDWAELRQNKTPEEFAAEYAEYKIAVERFENVQRERQNVQAKLRDADREALEARAAEESTKLLAAIPTWKDVQVREKESKELVAYATTVLGFTDDDIANVSDHRAFLMLRKSMQYDALMAKARAATQNKGKVTKTPSPAASRPSGTSTARVERDGFDKARGRLARTGSVRDAAAALDALFGE